MGLNFHFVDVANAFRFNEVRDPLPFIWGIVLLPQLPPHTGSSHLNPLGQGLAVTIGQKLEELGF